MRKENIYEAIQDDIMNAAISEEEDVKECDET